MAEIEQQKIIESYRTYAYPNDITGQGIILMRIADIVAIEGPQTNTQEHYLVTADGQRYTVRPGWIKCGRELPKEKSE